jgi:hypothetical protein
MHFATPSQTNGEFLDFRGKQTHKFVVIDLCCHCDPKKHFLKQNRVV